MEASRLNDAESLKPVCNVDEESSNATEHSRTARPVSKTAKPVPMRHQCAEEVSKADMYELWNVCGGWFSSQSKEVSRVLKDL